MSSGTLGQPASVLLLCDDSPDHAGNVLDHVSALTGLSRHDVVAFNPRIGDRGASLDLREFDVVVIHYTIVVIYDSYLPKPLVDRITAFDGLKIQFIQDEYRWVDEITAVMRKLGIDVLFTCVPEDVVPKIYSPRLPGVRAVTTLAGFVPDHLIGRAVPPLDERPVDVGYRGRAVPYWLGRLGQDKIEIGRGFLARAAGTDLRCDIAWTESDRLYGERWIRFMSSCRATLGTASGASVIDFDGTVESRVHAYLAEHSGATYDDVEHDILHAYEGNAEINVVSPRLFEAAVLRTALVLFPGGYSGTVEPWQHYIPLERDFSNFDEVARSLRDDTLLAELTERAYEDLVASGRYSLKAFVKEFDRLVDEHRPQSDRPTPPRARQRRRFPVRVRPQRPGAARRTIRRVASGTGIRRALSATPEASRLLAEYARSESAHKVVSRERLREDVAKLAVLIANQRARVSLTTPLAIVPILQGDRLILAARALDELDAERDDRARSDSLAALRAGAVTEMVWNHVRFGQVAWLQVTPVQAVPIDVGYYGVNGAHSFSALVRLRPILPDAVIAMVAAVLEPPRTHRLSAGPKLNAVMRGAAYALAAVHAAQLALPLLRRDPKSFALRGLHALRFASRHRAVRHLLRSYVAEPELRTSVDPLELLDDILKLQLVRAAGRGRETYLAATVDDRTGTLVLTTELGRPDAEAGRLPNGSLEDVLHLVWDNSARGSLVRLRGGVTATLDEDARHHFRAVSQITRRDSTRMKALIEVILVNAVKVNR